VWACVEMGGGALVRELIRQVRPTAAQRLLSTKSCCTLILLQCAILIVSSYDRHLYTHVPCYGTTFC
jgi:hypothetical protein